MNTPLTVDGMLAQPEVVAANIAYQTFAALIKASEEGVFLFCEGRDGRYYGSKIDLICNKEAHPIHSGNKKNVIETYKMIKNRREYTIYKTAFFVDKDFDLPLNNPDIYETPCYAVENLYCNQECFSNILKNEFGLTIVDDDYTMAMTHFETRLNEFNDAVLLLNAWYACTKDARYESNQPINLASLEKKLPENFVNITFDNISFSYTLADIERMTEEQKPNAFRINPQNLAIKVADFTDLTNKSCVFRGKYLMQFLAFYLATIAEKGNQKMPTFFTKKRKNHLTTDKDNTEKLLSSLAQYAITPPCLRQYLQRFV
ncbi:MAG: hypothetical protein RI894_2411 [Bacteroidota bacterium]|jgi:hypothetical protein